MPDSQIKDVAEATHAVLRQRASLPVDLFSLVMTACPEPSARTIELVTPAR